MTTTFRLINCSNRECSRCGDTRFELKCLPCSHNICTECLQSTRLMKSLNTSVYCPIDEHKFNLANNGTDSLPTKGHLIEVTSNRGHQNFDRPSITDLSEMSEMYELLTYTQEYRNDLAAAIRDMEHRIDASLSLQEERVKEEIRSTADALVDAVRAKEKELYQDVDRLIASEKRDRYQEIADFSLQAHHVIQVVEMNHGKFKPGRRDESLANKVQAQLLAVKQRKSSLMEDQENRLYEMSFEANNGCFEEPLGSVRCDRDIKEAGDDKNDGAKCTNKDGPIEKRRLSSQRDLKRKPGQVLSVMIPPSPLSEKFLPWAVSVSESGHIAVVDRGNNCIHIFDPMGDFLRHVAKPYGNKLLEVYGVTFMSRNTFAVSEYSPTTGSGCLIEMGISGEHLRVIANLKGPAHVTSFTSFSSSCKNIIAVYYTNSMEAPDVFGAREERKIELPVGKCSRTGLNHAQKGVHLKDKFIFSDSNIVANHGCVKVFDSDCQFVTSFGEQQLWNEKSLGHPLRIAADPLNCVLLVYQQFSNRMRVYDVTGACVLEFPTTSGLLDFTVAPDGRLVATCSKNSEFPNSVVTLSYM